MWKKIGFVVALLLFITNSYATVSCEEVVLYDSSKQEGQQFVETLVFGEEDIFVRSKVEPNVGYARSFGTYLNKVNYITADSWAAPMKYCEVDIQGFVHDLDPAQ